MRSTPTTPGRIGVAPADLAEIESEHGRAVLRVDRHQRPTARLAVRADALDRPARSAGAGRRAHHVRGRSVSGQPELKFTAVSAKRYPAAWHAFAVSAARAATAGADYFAVAPVRRGWKAELAGRVAPEDWTAFARAALGLDGDAEIVAYHDAAAGQRRFVAFASGTLAGAVFAAREPVAAARSWLAERLGERIAPEERLRLLAGRPSAEARDRGPTVCACFDVGRNEILEAGAKGCATVAAIGVRLKAGTNCGSCRGEIGKLIEPFARRRLAAP